MYSSPRLSLTFTVYCTLSLTFVTFFGNYVYVIMCTCTKFQVVWKYIALGYGGLLIAVQLPVDLTISCNMKQALPRISIPDISRPKNIDIILMHWMSMKSADNFEIRGSACFILHDMVRSTGNWNVRRDLIKLKIAKLPTYLFITIKSSLHSHNNGSDP
jgi:hypothetical protein